MSSNIPVVELSGTYQQMGQQFGERFKSQIKEFAQTRMQRIISFVKKYGKVDVSEAEVLIIADGLLNAHKNYDQDIWQEFVGISEAADISLPLLLVGMGYTDLRDYVCKVKGFNDIEVRFEGCTGFLLDKTMSSDNNIIIGQTWDMSVEAMDYLVIVKKSPTDDTNNPLSTKMMYLTTMGGLALIGLNSNSLAIGTTNLMANDCHEGVNYLFTITKALMQNTFTDMVNNIVNTNRMSGHSFICAGCNSASMIEASANYYINHRLDHYPLVKTNNYSETMREYEIYLPEQRRRNSVFRYARILSRLTEREKWSNQDLWELLADNYRNQSGAAICNEDYTGQYSEFATLATAILLPEKRQMWVCRGGALSGHRQVIDL